MLKQWICSTRCVLSLRREKAQLNHTVAVRSKSLLVPLASCHPRCRPTTQARALNQVAYSSSRNTLPMRSASYIHAARGCPGREVRGPLTAARRHISSSFTSAFVTRVPVGAVLHYHDRIAEAFRGASDITIWLRRKYFPPVAAARANTPATPSPPHAGAHMHMCP